MVATILFVEAHFVRVISSSGTSPAYLRSVGADVV